VRQRAGIELGKNTRIQTSQGPDRAAGRAPRSPRHDADAAGRPARRISVVRSQAGERAAEGGCGGVSDAGGGAGSRCGEGAGGGEEGGVRDYGPELSHL
jgi:hypothetical protein